MKTAVEEKDYITSDKLFIKETLNSLYGKKWCDCDVASYYAPYDNDSGVKYDRSNNYIDFNSRVLKNTLVDLKCNFKITRSINNFIITYRHSGLCFAEEFQIDFMANPDLFKKELNEIIYRFKTHVMNSFNRKVILMQSEIYKDLGIEE